MVVYGVWVFVNLDGVLMVVFYLVMIFLNIGGILNLVVFIIIRKRFLKIVNLIVDCII